MESESNIDSLVHQACDERARLLRAMQCSGAMFDTNMQCVSYIMSLKKEKSIQKNDASKEIEVCDSSFPQIITSIPFLFLVISHSLPLAQVLASRIEGLLSIVESQQKTIANHTQALTLKGMWASILAPHSATLTGIQIQTFGRDATYCSEKLFPSSFACQIIMLHYISA